MKDAFYTILVILAVMMLIWPESTGRSLRKIHDEFSIGWEQGSRR